MLQNRQHAQTPRPIRAKFGMRQWIQELEHCRGGIIPSIYSWIRHHQQQQQQQLHIHVCVVHYSGAQQLAQQLITILVACRLLVTNECTRCLLPLLKAISSRFFFHLELHVSYTAIWNVTDSQTAYTDSAYVHPLRVTVIFRPSIHRLMVGLHEQL